MFNLLTYTFMQHALVAALLISIAAGLVGCLVVVNRLVFLAGGIVHTAYGGVGLAVFLGLPVLPSTLGFSGLASALLGVLTLKQQHYTEALIGLLWSAGMAFGIILLELTPGYSVNLTSYLFGSILTVPAQDLWLMALLLMIISGLVIYFYQDLVAMSFDRQFAASRGVRVKLLHIMLLLITAMTAVMMVQLVGIIMVVALLTIPAYLAAQYSRSLAAMMVSAVGWSLLFCLLGLWGSYYTNISSGAAIVAVATLFLLAFFLVKGLIYGYRMTFTRQM
jgi:zinc transport system permease protein